MPHPSPRLEAVYLDITDTLAALRAGANAQELARQQLRQSTRRAALRLARTDDLPPASTAR